CGRGASGTSRTSAWAPSAYGMPPIRIPPRLPPRSFTRRSPRRRAPLARWCRPVRSREARRRLQMEDRMQAFLFDLDGTLIDSVYQHVLAWQDALDQMGIELAVWRIHRKIGMSGGLFAHALQRETGQLLTPDETARLRKLHAESFRERAEQLRPLPGARALLAYLTEAGVPWAIATSGYLESAAPMIEMLEVGADVPVITRDQVAHAKPDPD